SRITDDYSMIRIKAPSGQIYPHQLRKLAQLSESFSIGSAHVSTRQSIQLHWVVLEDVSEVMRGLAEVGMTSREACGNSVRNVMCSPLSGVCPDEEFDATPYAFAITKFFLRNPLSQNLPRKFKFNFTCCEKHGMARMVDVGLIPQTRKINGEIQRGFKIFLGGGLGNKSFVGHQLEEFTPEEDLLYTSIATVRIFDRLGNRKNLARNRMRYLVDEMGWENFQNTILKERAIMRATQSITIKLDVDDSKTEIKKPIKISEENGIPNSDGYSRWYKTSTIKQKQDGYHCVFINLEAGDITSNHLLSLADICQEFSGEGFARNSFSQGIVLRWVSKTDLPRLYVRLIDAGLAKSGSLTMASSVGCSGTTSCNLALTNSHRLAKEVQRKFLELKLDEEDDLDDSTIKISGCPNSCGQHEIATIGFYGGGGRVGKDMYPNYQMSLGGRSDGNTMLGINCMRIPAKRVIPVILKIIELFKENKKPDDKLSFWINRIIEEKEDSEIKTISDFKTILSPLIVPPTMNDDRDFYSDYGSDTNYHAVTGKGECAA
ncbi:MAG: nitrite/sulfite reductase, partial [Nitrosopumilus sp.]|nr:nitrite/sulfite reductase [Nitrosopumilus sp.]